MPIAVHRNFHLAVNRVQCPLLIGDKNLGFGCRGNYCILLLAVGIHWLQGVGIAVGALQRDLHVLGGHIRAVGIQRPGNREVIRVGIVQIRFVCCGFCSFRVPCPLRDKALLLSAGVRCIVGVGHKLIAQGKVCYSTAIAVHRHRKSHRVQLLPIVPDAADFKGEEIVTCTIAAHDRPLATAVVVVPGVAPGVPFQIAGIQRIGISAVLPGTVQRAGSRAQHKFIRMVGVAVHQPHNGLTAVNLAVVNVIAQRNQRAAGVLHRVQLHDRVRCVFYPLTVCIVVVNINITRAGGLLQGLFQRSLVARVCKAQNVAGHGHSRFVLLCKYGQTVFGAVRPSSQRQRTPAGERQRGRKEKRQGFSDLFHVQLPFIYDLVFSGTDHRSSQTVRPDHNRRCGADPRGKQNPHQSRDFAGSLQG